MTAALTIRATVLMSIMPGADYSEVMAALLGDLVLVPWHRPYQVPTAKVLSTWREALGPAPLAGLQARLLAAVDAEHRDHDYRAVRVGDSSHELQLCSIDGSVTRVPDTPANREAFGSTGTADDSSPYPQVRDLLATDASTRGTWRWSPALPAGPRPRANRHYWIPCSPPAPRSSPPAACSCSTVTSPAPTGWPGCSRPAPTS